MLTFIRFDYHCQTDTLNLSKGSARRGTAAEAGARPVPGAADLYHIIAYHSMLHYIVIVLILILYYVIIVFLSYHFVSYFIHFMIFRYFIGAGAS